MSTVPSTASSPDPALRVENLSLRINGARIVEDVSFEVTPGEFVAIIGPNGAGKTSFFNLLSGTMRATAGKITMLGKDITYEKTHVRARNGLGRTFQTSYLLLGLTVLENVRLQVQAATVRGLGLLGGVKDGEQSVEEAMAALDRVGLADKAHWQAGALSHGDRRKVELAIVLASRAKVVLLDEPMAGVNNEDVDGLVELIRELHTISGSTVLMVEHHLHVVLGLAERVAVMHHGALLAIDTPDKIMSDERVQTAYVGEAL